MISRPLSDWKPVKWLPVIETRTIGVFLSTSPAIHYDMLPYFTEWRFRLNRRDRP